jgi:ABC-type branched-subunit amino acid transport system substrate-binding protein
MPLFEKAKLPVIGADVLAPVDGTSPMAFPIDTGVPGPDIAAPFVAKKYLGASQLGVIQQDQAQTKANIPYFEIGSKQAGIPVSKYLTVPSDANDMSSYVTQGQDAGIHVLMSTMQGPQTLATWKAIGSTKADMKLIVSGSSVGQQVVDQAGALADGSYVINGVPNPDASNDTGKQYTSEMAKYQPAEKVMTGLGLRAWADVHLFADVAKTMKGDITRASFLPALQKVHGMHFLWIDSLSFNKPGPISTLPRIVSTVIFPSVVKNAKITTLDKFDPFAS